MKRFLPQLLAVVFISYSAHAQITITAADMPQHGDMLSYSNAAITGTGFSPADSGVNRAWNYTLTANSQGVDTYKLAYDVNPSYAGTISLSAIGYKVADSIPGLSTITMLPITITNIYTYFQKITTPRSAYMASALSYTLAGLLPVAANYSDPDVWYFFPLTYGSGTDSNHYALHISLMSAAGIDEVGYRKTHVDGYGTITTPYFTTPVNCIRVRSEIHEIDSVNFSGTNFGFPRNSVEYKFLVNGEHYPALWITSTVINDTENVTMVRYRDVASGPVSVVNEKPSIYDITAFPNPTATGIVTLGLPADWKTFQAEVFDVNAKQVTTISNSREINLSSFAAGQYFIRVTSGSKAGYTTVVKN